LIYNQRGIAEQHIMTSWRANTPFVGRACICARFRDKAVRLKLRALAYNLVTFLRWIELPKAMAEW